MAWNWEWSASPKDLCVCFLCTFGYSPVGISMTVSKYLFFHWHVNKWYQTFLSSLYFQVVWRPPPWHQAQGAPLPVWLHWRVQFTVCGLFPLPLLCLHVPCHHLRRTSGRGNRRTHSKSLSPSLWMLTVFRRDWLCSAANLRPDNSSTMVRISLINHPSIISPSVFPRVQLSRCSEPLWLESPIPCSPGSRSPFWAARDQCSCLRRFYSNSASMLFFFFHVTVHVNHLRLPVHLIYTWCIMSWLHWWEWVLWTRVDQTSGLL